MKITALVENTSTTELKAKHGLSLYIETKKHKILFDLGSDRTLFENAEMRKIDLSTVDTVILSHGHVDHGGALKQFLAINKTAKIYVQKAAFEPHYSKTLFLKVPVGIDAGLKDHEQVVLAEGDLVIDEELSLFTTPGIDKCHSHVNDVLYEGNKKDTFAHEQNLLIKEAETALIMGCGHAGVVNIMEKAESFHPRICVGGFHLFNPITNKSVSDTLLNEIAFHLKKYEETDFYTCHCTGMKAFDHLSRQFDHLHYLSCGETIEL